MEKLENLLARFEPILKERIVSPRTGAPFAYPESSSLKYQLLQFMLYDPDVALIWGSDLALSQLAIWTPYIKRSKKRFVIFAKRQRDSRVNLPCPSYTVEEGFNAPLFASVAPSLKTFIYMTDKAANFSYVRACPHVVHVCGHHGDSDKHSSSSRVTSVYDYMLVADKHSMNRYIGAGSPTPPDRYIPIGNTIVEGALRDEGHSLSFSKVLYAPTFEGHSEEANYSSLLRASNAISQFIKEGGQLAVRTHPGTGKRDAKYRDQKLVMHAFPTKVSLKTKSDQFNWSEVLVADLSGIISEYLFTLKPIVVPIPGNGHWLNHQIKETSLSAYAYLWDYEQTSLADFLKTIATDPLRNARVKRSTDLYCNFDSIEKSATNFDRALDFFALSQTWKMMRFSAFHTPYQSAPATELPEDLQELVNEIRQGKNTNLGALPTLREGSLT
jgi:hypothetical protein